MKRDMDLVRNILLRYEAAGAQLNGLKPLNDLADEAVLRGHLQMLEDAGYIDDEVVHLSPPLE